MGTRYMCAIPKTLMTPYHKKFGFVIGVTKLLDAANVTFHDLPYIQRHKIERANNLYYTYYLRACTSKNCERYHVSGRELPESLCTKIRQKLEFDVRFMSNNNAPANTPNTTPPGEGAGGAGLSRDRGGPG